MMRTGEAIWMTLCPRSGRSGRFPTQLTAPARVRQNIIIKEVKTMDQKKLALWLKIIIIVTALCGIAICGLVLPMVGQSIADSYGGEFDYAFWPCLIFLWICALPCFAALAIGWRIASNIGRDRSFTEENAKLISVISILAAADSVFFFVGNVVLLCFSCNHPGFVVLSLVVTFVGIAVSIGLACLSHLVRKAAGLQAESDLTI